MKAKGNVFWFLVLLASAAALAYWHSSRTSAPEPPSPAAPPLPSQAPAPSAPAPAPAAAPPPSAAANACLQQAESELRQQPLPSKKGETAVPAAERFRRYQEAVRRCSVQPSR